MEKKSKYKSKKLDESGRIEWTDDEDAIWNDLITRQIGNISGKACDEYLHGVDLLKLDRGGIPQIEDVNHILGEKTGWGLYPVPALIDFDKFFSLLSEKRFPVATFIRSRDEFDYLQEPDIFHEILGHCPMLTDADFAQFTHAYGRLGLAADTKDRVWLARLYWFTVEFGLMETSRGLRIYGGGILSSPAETAYAFNSDIPERKPFEPVDVLRTPYRIDILQPIYFKIRAIHDLYELAQADMMAYVKDAQRLGLHEPKFPPKPSGDDKVRRVATDLRK